MFACLQSACTNTDTRQAASHAMFAEPTLPACPDHATVQMMACIGEQFTEGDEICGIVVNVRARQDRLCMWTKTASNEAAQARQLASKAAN